ncbi:MAG: hypothetical protein GEU99_26635 [Luteitalea sp.]|nr:hypothetical protein [Luteitalea sp.]
MKWPTEAAFRRRGVGDPFHGHLRQTGSRRPFGRLGLAVIVAIVAVSHGCASRGEAPVPPEPSKPPSPVGPVWFARASEPEFVTFRDTAGQVSIEHPKQDWQSAPGGQTTLATFTQTSGEATVVLEQTQLNQALAPDEVTDVFGEIEQETITEREPDASGFQRQLINAGDRRIVGIQYQRPGPQGPEWVRQYSFPVAETLYRLTCVIEPDKQAQYEPICAHMAASFTVLGS